MCMCRMRVLELRDRFKVRVLFVFPIRNRDGFLQIKKIFKLGHNFQVGLGKLAWYSIILTLKG